MARASRYNRSNRALGIFLPLVALFMVAPVACGLDPQGTAFDPNGGAGGESVTASVNASASSGTGVSTSNSAGSGGSTSASGAGGATTTSSTGAGGTVTLDEDCLDSMDNDGDSMIDCADPDCSPGFECVAAPPAGWTLVRPEKTAYLPPTIEPCPDQSKPAIFFRAPDDGTCTQCSCSPSQNACQPPEMTCYIGNGNPDCASGSAFTVAPSDENCLAADTFPPANEKIGCKITKPSGVANGANCKAGKPSPVNDDIFGGEMHICDLPPLGAGCSAGLVCVPVGNVQFDKTCITKEGTDACPAPFSNSTQTYASGTDERVCTPCDCSGVSLSCAGDGKMQVWSVSDCTGNVTDFSVNTSCTEVTGAFGANTAAFRAYNTPNPMKNGSCNGGAPAGNGVVTTGPQKVCCQ